MSLRFTKMHGLGNDFVVLDARTSPLTLDTARIRAIADRHRGVGFDQMMILEPARNPACLAAYSIRNADGTVAPQCGNGARCLGAWLHRDGALATNIDAMLESPVGIVRMRLVDATTVTVEMGEPEFEPERIPFDAPAAADTYLLDVDGERIEISAASMGSRHAVIEVDDISSALADRLGPRITVHPRFPQGANACFVHVVDEHFVKLRVHERGAGWTLACGSGACATVAALHRRGRVGEDARVEMPGGTLTISWKGPGHALSMTGPAAFSFDGEWLGI
jgi:diaminopimelate epimerase